jgi:hypothetical protein
MAIRAADPYSRKPGTDLIASALQVLADNESLRTSFDKQLDAYHQRTKISIPGNVVKQKVRSGQAPEIVERIKGFFSGYPKVSALPRSTSAQALEFTGTVEDWLNAFFAQSELEAGREQWGLAQHDAFVIGRGCTYVFRDLSVYRGMPRALSPAEMEGKTKDEIAQLVTERNTAIDRFKETAPLPILWRHTPGFTVFPVYDDRGTLAEVYEVGVQRAMDIAARYPQSNFARQFTQMQGVTGRKSLLVPFCRYANRRYMAFAVLSGPTTSLNLRRVDGGGGEVLRQPFLHGIDEVPYVLYDGHVTSDLDPGLAVFGVLHHMLPQLEYYDNLLSQFGANIRMWAWPTPVLRTQRGTAAAVGSEEARPRPFEIEEGKMAVIYEDEELTFLVVEQGSDINEMIAVVSRFLDRMGLASVAFGSPGDVRSGFGIETLLQAAQSKMAPFEKHFSQGWERQARLVLKTLMAIGQPVPVFDRRGAQSVRRELDPNDLMKHGLPELRCEIKAEIISNLPARVQTAVWARQTTPALWSHRRAQEYTGVDDPDRENDLIILDEIKNSPQVKQAIAEQGLKIGLAKVQKTTPPPAMSELGGMSPALAGAIASLNGAGQPIDPQILQLVQARQGAPLPAMATNVGGVSNTQAMPTMGMPAMEQAGQPQPAAAPETPALRRPGMPSTPKGARPARPGGPRRRGREVR